MLFLFIDVKNGLDSYRHDLSLRKCTQLHPSLNVPSGQGATKLFSWLKDCKPDRTGGVRHLPYDASKADKHAKFCFDNIERAAQHLNHEKMKADQQQEVRERHQRALEKVRKS